MKADPAREEALVRLLRMPLGAVERDEKGGPASVRARELVAGVRRHLATLDAVVERYVPNALARVEPRLLEALRIGAFQLLYEPAVPRPLVVASTVALAGGSARRRGFLNAVLRRAATEIVAEAVESHARSQSAIVTGRNTVARFPEPVLPDFEADLVGYLCAQYSQTRWLVESLLRDVGAEIDALLLALMLPLPVAVRVNRLRTDQVAAESALHEAGATILRRFGPVLEMRFDGPLTALGPFREGLVTVQDLVASEVAPVVDPQPGERILDLCAGTGGKSTHLAELAGGKAVIVAADNNDRQLAKLEENLARLQTPNVTPLRLVEGALEKLPPFDRALVDAPCSNSGVLMKRVAARWRQNPDATQALAKKQLELLELAAARLRPSGVLVYSTCSILRDENEAVVERFLERQKGAFTLASSRTSYPHRTGRDGGFVARLERRG
jgi:16S rRNA (cytosine967-C5)-methyltransferase